MVMESSVVEEWELEGREWEIEGREVRGGLS